MFSGLLLSLFASNGPSLIKLFNKQYTTWGEIMNQIEKLPREIKFIWRLTAYIDFLILILVTIGIFIWKNLAPTGMKQPLVLVFIILLVISFITLTIELALVNYHWNFWTYLIDERRVELHHGYFFRKQTIIPIARVQNVTLKQGPLLRLKNLQKIEIVTAAGSSNIDGLTSPQADSLKELIMKLAQEAQNDL